VVAIADWDSYFSPFQVTRVTHFGSKWVTRVTWKGLKIGASHGCKRVVLAGELVMHFSWAVALQRNIQLRRAEVNPGVEPVVGLPAAEWVLFAPAKREAVFVSCLTFPSVDPSKARGVLRFPVRWVHRCATFGCVPAVCGVALCRLGSRIATVETGGNDHNYE
jgi:hypothetical protein